MQIYLVGGAVRDTLLNLPVVERDWLVVGSSVEQMQALGYQAVGKDFPVFLHPITHEEYALARTERKTAKGYTGFVFHASPDVTLEEDLKRRDLTINAMAQDTNGQLIDPYQGQRDLKEKRLRHVSSAFAEDPVRILRLARFAAKLPDFSVDPHTMELMRTMVQHGEVDALISERVWQELKRALNEVAPQRFFDVLQQCGAGAILFPELSKKIPHLNNPLLTSIQRFALLLSQADDESVYALCKRYKVPHDYADLAKALRLISDRYLQLDTHNAHAILHFLKSADALRRKQRFDHLIELCSLIHGINHHTLLTVGLDAIQHIDTHPLQEKKLKGIIFAQALEALQINALSKALQL